MLSVLAIVALVPLALAQAANKERILGVYMFHRHGDRTPKVLAPTNLTDLGYWQVYTSGQYYRNRYIASDASFRIDGVNSDLVKHSQITVSAPDDTVLQNSALGFLQALYPPVGSSVGTETLRNGSKVTAPMDGYQLIPVDEVTTGHGSENNGWLQSTNNCPNAQVSSDNYFSSDEYLSLSEQSKEFYQSLAPVTNSTFDASQLKFKNAYTIFDYINVAQIHNTTIPSSDLLTPSTLEQLRTLSDTHEWSLAYNSSDPIRAIAGKTLAAQILTFLNSTLTSAPDANKIAIQFGAYATFSSFFGLAGLAAADHSLQGVVDYASAMTFELFTNTSTTPLPRTSPAEQDDVYVRFLFHNGPVTPESEPVAYPLFGAAQEVVRWTDFVEGMGRFAVGNTEAWCDACGNSTGACAAYVARDGRVSGSASLGGSGGGRGNGLSPAVNGVVGAMVALAVVLGLEALVLVVGGFRVVSKKTLGTDVNEMTKA